MCTLVPQFQTELSDLVATMAERGIARTHDNSAVVQHYTPKFEKRWNAE